MDSQLLQLPNTVYKVTLDAKHISSFIADNTGSYFLIELQSLTEFFFFNITYIMQLFETSCLFPKYCEDTMQSNYWDNAKVVSMVMVNW